MNLGSVTRNLQVVLLTTVLLMVLAMTMFSTGAELDLPTRMPVVYVDPQEVTASKGETFTISVKIFNLSDAFFLTDDEWTPGNSLGKEGSSYNYSLGNLLGFDLQFSWDPAILQYQNHTVMVPIDEHPEGVLYDQVMELKDEANATMGTYWIAEVTLGYFDKAFNKPGMDATVFTMTFSVIEEEQCSLSLEEVSLAAPWQLGDAHEQEIPHWTVDGSFGSTTAGEGEAIPIWLVIIVVVLVASLAILTVYFLTRRSDKPTPREK